MDALLRLKNLQFFSDGSTENPDAGTTATGETAATDNSNSTEVSTETSTSTDTDTGSDTKKDTESATSDKSSEKEIMIPKERFDDVNNKYKTLSAQVEKMQKDKEEMERLLQDMKQESEKTTSSIEDTTAKLETQVKQYESLMNEMVETKLKAVPEEMHDLVPDGLTVEQKLAWLNKAEAKGLFKKEQPVIGTPLNHSAELQQKEKMKSMNPLQLLSSFYSEKK